MNVQRFITFVLLVSLAIALGASVTCSSAASPLAPVPSHALYHTFFCRNYFDYTSTLYLQNPTNSTVDVVLDFYDLTWGGGTISVDQTIPARGTLVVPGDSVDGLWDGEIYSLVVSSDQPVQSVVHVHRSSGDGDGLGVYRGVSSGSTLQHFGPFYKNKDGSELYSGLTVWNVGTATTTIIADFLNTDGSKVTTVEAVVAPGEQYTYLGLVMHELPDGFSGWVRITATQPVVGLLGQSALFSYLVYQGPLGTGATQSYIPRALKGVDEGGGPRTTTVFVGNTGSAEANATLDYHIADGTLDHSSTFTLPASGAITFDLGDEGNLSSGNTWAVALSGNQPLVIGEQTDYDTTSYSTGVYGTDADTVLDLPRLARTDTAHTVFSVQNLGVSATMMSVDYYDLTGALVLNQSATLSPGGWVRYDQSQMTELGESFEGSAIVASDQPLKAWVDEYIGRFTIYLPIITKLWPPVPDTPMLYHIINPDGDGNYMVCWSTAARATSYTMEEDDNSAFSSPTMRYSGSGTCWTASDKEIGTYYYRVMASNSWGNSGWSNVQSVRVQPTQWVTILSEDFEGSFPGSTWEVRDNDPDSGRYYWGKRNCRNHGGSFSAWSVGAGDTTLSCGSNYPNDVFAWMIYGPFSLTDATAAQLTFDWWSDTEYGYDAFFWGASTNGEDYYGTMVTGNWASWTAGELLDLSTVPTLGNLLGEDQVWIAFGFGSDSRVTARGSFVDNVLLRKRTGIAASRSGRLVSPQHILQPDQTLESVSLRLNR
jgi:hypothetical protein